MSITLSPKLEEFVRKELAAGEYHSAEEVVSEALHLLRQKRQLEALRASVRVGVEQEERGDIVPWDLEEMKAEVRRRIEAHGQDV